MPRRFGTSNIQNSLQFESSGSLRTFVAFLRLPQTQKKKVREEDYGALQTSQHDLCTRASRRSVNTRLGSEAKREAIRDRKQSKTMLSIWDKDPVVRTRVRTHILLLSEVRRRFRGYPRSLT